MVIIRICQPHNIGDPASTKNVRDIRKEVMTQIKHLKFGHNIRTVCVDEYCVDMDGNANPFIVVISNSEEERDAVLIVLTFMGVEIDVPPLLEMFIPNPTTMDEFIPQIVSLLTSILKEKWADDLKNVRFLGDSYLMAAIRFFLEKATGEVNIGIPDILRVLQALHDAIAGESPSVQNVPRTAQKWIENALDCLNAIADIDADEAKE